jgi:4-alpha-glucanotransferase
MNLPGRAEGNWRWRVDPALVDDATLDQLAELTTVYQRDRSATATS